MTTKAKVIAGVVGGVLVVGGIGSAFNKGKDEDNNSSDISSSISQSVSSTDLEPEKSKDSSKVYTIGEFCTRFENEDNFAHDHKDQIFTVSGAINRISYKSLYFESDVKSEKWTNNYIIECKFESKEILEPLDADMQATISGKLSSLAISSITLKDCTVVAFENPENSSSSEDPSESSTSEQSSEPEQSSTTESDSQSSEPTENTSETSSTVESEPQSTPQESESNAEVSSVSSISSAEPELSSVSSSSDVNPGQITGYVFNTNTKKYHRPNCSSVKDIKPENYAKYIDESEFAQYSPCKRCNP